MRYFNFNMMELKRIDVSDIIGLYRAYNKDRRERDIFLMGLHGIQYEEKSDIIEETARHTDNEEYRNMFNKILKEKNGGQKK